MDSRQQVKQVVVATYNSEPLARLAAQRLQESKINCVVQPIGVGPGGWGFAANLPYALFVHPSDKEHAQVLLHLPRGETEVPNIKASGSRTPLIFIMVAAAVTLIVADRVFGRLFGS